MAINASASSAALCVLSKYSYLCYGRSEFERCSFPSSCCGAPTLSSCAINATNASLLRPKASQSSRQPMLAPYNVLITGSTKGIGFALAKEFLRAGDNVVICSRSVERVAFAVQIRGEEFGEQHVWGTKCDVKRGNM